MSWIELPIGEVCELNYGFNLPKKKRQEGVVPVYSSAGHIDYHNESKVSAPGIVVGRKGSIGTIYYVNQDYYPIDTCYYIEPNDSTYDIKFLYYSLKIAGLDQFNNDAAVPGLNRNTAYSQKIKIPPLPTQRRIASILSAYDDLIENNLKRIKLLEEAAQNIYREWFVEMRFPGHETVTWTEDEQGRKLPEGWEFQVLESVALLNYGKSLRKDKRNENGIYPVYGSSGIVGSHDEYLVEGPGVILGRKGNVGSVFLSLKNFFPIDTVYYVTSELSILFIYQWLKNESFVSSDAAVPGLNRNYAYSKEILVPNQISLDHFDSICKPLIDEIELLGNANQLLKEARDILLPRLMNQTITV